LDFFWTGSGQDEKMVLANYLSEETQMEKPILIQINPKFYRPNEVNLLLGDSSLARKELGWNPQISFDKLAKTMISSDLNELGLKANKGEDGQKTQ